MNPLRSGTLTTTLLASTLLASTLLAALCIALPTAALQTAAATGAETSSSESAVVKITTPAAAASPEEVVDALENALLQIMQLPDSSTITRAELLKPVLLRTFDFERMSRFIFGINWAQFTELQRQEFIHALLELSCASYAANFDDYNNERFEPIEERTSNTDNATRVRVSHHLITRKQKVEFNYALTLGADGWRIANIMAKGVSDLALKRTQYSKLYSAGGMAAVLEYIVIQTERLYAS
ncbi:MAG: ABC transporter substrate-binding protein [Gammaproteobacteria bacterium]|nr:ABC transporter substrate-binding protein [Gammaproteobacteria bacterium]